MSLRPMTAKEAVEFAKLEQDWLAMLGLMERLQHPAYEVADYLAVCLLTSVVGSELVWDVPIELSESDILLDDGKGCKCKACCIPATADVFVGPVS